MKLHPVVPTILLLGALAVPGCRKVPLTPSTPIPAGSVVFRFTRKVQGPVEFMLDGARLQIEQLPKGAHSLIVRGISPGKHKFFLTSQHEAFSPDLGDLDMSGDKGLYFVTLTQPLDAVLYGKADALPLAGGVPGVTALLIK